MSNYRCARHPGVMEELLTCRQFHRRGDGIPSTAFLCLIAPRHETPVSYTDAVWVFVHWAADPLHLHVSGGWIRSDRGPQAYILVLPGAASGFPSHMSADIQAKQKYLEVISTNRSILFSRHCVPACKPPKERSLQQMGVALMSAWLSVKCGPFTTYGSQQPGLQVLLGLLAK